MKIYIFSNCKKSGNNTYIEHLDSLGIQKTDKLVFLNKCLLLYGFKYFDQFPDKVAILRAYRVYKTTGYFGHQDLIGKPGMFKEVFLFDHDLADIRITVGTQQKSSKIEVSNKWMQDYIDATGKIPTTGYASIFLIKDIYKVALNDITLINFYGSADNSTGKCDEHAWDYEEKYIEANMNRVFV